MMAYDFPTNPTNGQMANGYMWNGYAWALAGGGSAAGVSIGDTPPSLPAAGQLWWDSDTGGFYIYYDDGSSQAWVQLNAVGAEAAGLTASGPITSSADDQIIEYKDVTATAGHGITITHDRVTVRYCRVAHGHTDPVAFSQGIVATGCAGVNIHDTIVTCASAPSSGENPNENRNNIQVEDCTAVVIDHVRLSKGAANIYAQNCPGIRISYAQMLDARGPLGRGQHVQFNHCDGFLLENFSGVNNSNSRPEDQISAIVCNGGTIRLGLVDYNNSESGDGVMCEGSTGILVQDVDFVHQGNGAWAAVGSGTFGQPGYIPSGPCTFERCRTRDNHSTGIDGLPDPASGGLSIYVGRNGNHSVLACKFFNINLSNKIYDYQYVVDATFSFTSEDFTPRLPLNLTWVWE
jgi:hypothetical protein